MSEEQFTALLAKLKDDAGLLEKIKGAADLSSAQAIAKEAGFDVSEADLQWNKRELSDAELDAVAGGLDCMPGKPAVWAVSDKTK